MLTLLGLALWRPLDQAVAAPSRRYVRLGIMLLIAVALVAFGAYRLMNARSVQLLGHQVASVELTRRSSR